MLGRALCPAPALSPDNERFKRGLFVILCYPLSWAPNHEPPWGLVNDHMLEEGSRFSFLAMGRREALLSAQIFHHYREEMPPQ